MDRLTVNKLIA